MFGTTVFNLDDEVFEHPMAEYKARKGYKLDIEMTAEDWKALVDLQGCFQEACRFDFPQDVYKQLELATKAVFESWMGKRAIDYRKATKIRMISAPPSTFRRWSSVTWVMTLPPAWPSPATRPPATRK
jgi:pyruvate, orthophosphate dikinase